MPFIPSHELPSPWFMGLSALVAPGAVLLPGNWGRVIRARAEQGVQDAKEQVAYEDVFEEIRLKVAQDAPSRLSCLYVSPDVAAAHHFRDTMKSGRTDVLYRVEPVEMPAEVFVARWSLWNWREIREGTSLKARKSARRYWTEPVAGQAREILVPCPVRIIAADQPK